MFQHQESLPRLPLPTVENTLRRYLEQVEPLVTPAQFEEAKRDVALFAASKEAQAIQSHLLDMRERTPNWLSRLWSDSYLTDRDPPGLHVSPSLGFESEHVAILLNRDQTAVAAEICVVATAMQRAIHSRTLPVDQIRGSPLCMEDYTYFMGAVRIPNVGRDIVVRAAPESVYWHGVVMCRGHAFELPLATPTWSADSDGLRQALKRIRDEADRLEPSLVNTLTYLHRDDWAATRSHMMGDSQNRLALHRIESALFVLSLDDVAPNDDTPDALHALMHGHSAEQAKTGAWAWLDRWWDKSIHFHVGQNGAAGLTFEHSAMDSLPVLYFARAIAKHVKQLKAASSGPTTKAPVPRRIVFHVDAKVQQGIARGVARLKKTLSHFNIENITVPYPTKLLRQHNISPDGVVQACLDVAFRHTRGSPPSTYESAATKTFLNGRTETLRPNTKSMQRFQALFTTEAGKKARSDQSVVDALRAVSKEHNAIARAASQGQGCDRHLMGVSCAAEELGLRLPAFLSNDAYKTFKTITLSTTHPFWSEGSKFVCFGPVISPLCIGAGYFVAPTRLTLGISTWRKDKTDDSSQRFKAAFLATLDVIKKALSVVPTPPPAASKL